MLVRIGLVVVVTAAIAFAIASCTDEEAPETTAPAMASPAALARPNAAPNSEPPTPTATPTSVPTPSPTPTALLAPPTVGPGSLREMAIEPAFPNLEFDKMVHIAYPEDGTNRLFLVLQPGRVMVFDNDRDVSTATTFLDIRDRVNDRGTEEGLLGLAFDPSYSSNGRFYVYYSASPPRRSIISRFTASVDDPNRADPTSERVVLEVRQPFPNHNGGHLVFGPDGYLYIGLGDGGAAADPARNGQDLSTLLGSILRIDPRSVAPDGAYAVPPDNPFVGAGEGARPEIWAYGLRNPWRFTFDRETGELWAGDVGQVRWEEIDIIKRGLNYGWNLMEGFHDFSIGDGDRAGLELPVIEYGHKNGCSVTGGYVYRGTRLPSLIGAYVYGDFCSGKIWALRHDGERVTEHLQLLGSSLTISAFGEDQTGELYILSFDRRIYRLTPR